MVQVATGLSEMGMYPVASYYKVAIKDNKNGKTIIIQASLQVWLRGGVSH